MKPLSPKEFTLQIEALLKAKKMMKMDFMRAIDKPLSYFSAWSKGEKRPYYDDLAVMADVLGVTTDVLVYGQSQTSIELTSHRKTELQALLNESETEELTASIVPLIRWYSAIVKAIPQPIKPESIVPIHNELLRRFDKAVKNLSIREIK